jgi:3-oxoacyl-[acyl-carrier protein] reductase
MATYPEGVTALVTGGASGIGAACAKRLAGAGVRVVTADVATGVVGPSAPLVDVDLEDWRRTFRINVDGTFLLCRAFVPAMAAAGWGRVVNLASIAAKDGNPNQSAYSASKAAVIALTKSLGKEVAQTGVLANVVAPAAVESPMNAGTDPAILARSQSLTPMARMGRPEEIAELVAWLCSEALSFSTGAVYDASGGRASY